MSCEQLVGWFDTGLICIDFIIQYYITYHLSSLQLIIGFTLQMIYVRLGLKLSVSLIMKSMYCR